MNYQLIAIQVPTDVIDVVAAVDKFEQQFGLVPMTSDLLSMGIDGHTIHLTARLGYINKHAPNPARSKRLFNVTPLGHIVLLARDNPGGGPWSLRDPEAAAKT